MDFEMFFEAGAEAENIARKISKALRSMVLFITVVSYGIKTIKPLVIV